MNEGGTVHEADEAGERVLWQHLEVIHAVVYFAPQVDEALRAVGLKGFWMGYFASRAAAMGPVDAAVVQATFFNFHPGKVERAIPDAWSLAAPARILDARHDAAGQVLRAAWAPLAPETIAVAADLATRAASTITGEGRPLAAAQRALPLPEEPVDRLWWAATVLREHRGDGHVALLTGAGIDGCEAHVLQAATDRVPADVLQRARGWSDDDWQAARDRLAGRGWLDAEGRATEAGRAWRADLEQRTDELAAPPYATLTAAERADLLGALEVLSPVVADALQLPFPNPIGLERPPVRP